MERGTDKKSHVIAIVYEGKRSSLGKSTSEYSLTKKAKKYIENIFMNSPKEKALVKKRSAAVNPKGPNVRISKPSNGNANEGGASLP